MEWLVDAFNGGELTALEDAEEVLGKLLGAQVRLLVLCHNSAYCSAGVLGLCVSLHHPAMLLLQHATLLGVPKPASHCSTEQASSWALW
jgi:hypothetical protein